MIIFPRALQASYKSPFSDLHLNLNNALKILTEMRSYSIWITTEHIETFFRWQDRLHHHPKVQHYSKVISE